MASSSEKRKPGGQKGGDTDEIRRQALADPAHAGEIIDGSDIHSSSKKRLRAELKLPPARIGRRPGSEPRVEEAREALFLGEPADEVQKEFHLAKSTLHGLVSSLRKEGFRVNRRRPGDPKKTSNNY